MNEAIAQARSFLFVPGNRAERFDKALASGADAVIIDLEDSVPHGEKARARAAIANAAARLASGSTPVLVRVNAFRSAAWSDDVALVRTLEGIAGVMVPKAESAEMLGIVEQWTIPLIETALGVSRMAEVAGAPRVLRLALGHLDFLADTGMVADEDEAQLTPLRFAMTVLSRTHDLPPPVDGVTARFDAEEPIRRDVQRARGLGFGAKLCIHPRQVAWIHAAFAPTELEVQWAQRVVDGDTAARGQAFQLDGRMVDAPVVTAARRTLANAQRR